MKDSKKWYQSKSVWGGIVALLAVLLGAFGYSITGDDQSLLIDSLSIIGGAVGSLVAIYGRVKASKRVSKD
ncbi:MAG: hypothetical protein Tp136SUR676911_30 [Prokaryotic dsDNA virus sp.]|jgi:protein-S-isoprenylcysteine O-methyltransferase Ste14|nr:MAG: hypothetical protein Tp136SUR676911_30 [Prokaryotic dsDNA virus sp.]|tara:strand:- start:17353 stop:17565 length:213 start_codon:yes stop_codon:yes gene_type:complete